MKLIFNKLRKPNIALELITDQFNDVFGFDIEAQLTVLLEKIKSKEYHQDETIPDSLEVKNIVNIVKKRTGLTIDLVCNKPEHPAAVIPFYSNRYHVFLHEALRGMSDRSQQKVLNKSNSQKGTVNVDTVFVTGIFSDYEVQVFMCFRKLFMEWNLTIPEVTAIFLHELGHAFYACEYSDRLETTNQIMADAFRELTSTKDKKDMKYVYRELSTINPEIAQEEVDGLLSENHVIFGNNLTKVIFKVVTSQLSNKTYDKTAFEASADNFTSRFGYGRQLVTGLDKILRVTNSRPTTVFVTCVYLLTVLAFIGTILDIAKSCMIIKLSEGVFAKFMIAFQVSMLIASFFLILYNSRTDKKDMTYDGLRERYARIRKDTINALKDNSIPEKKSIELIEIIKYIDQAMEGISEFKTFYGTIANIVFSDSRATDRDIAIQRLSESLVSNDLFLKSAELKLQTA